MSWRRAVAGVVLLALYFVAAFRLTPGPLRPLYDGFAPAPDYQWVSPPPELADDNRRPQVKISSVAMGEKGTVASTVFSEDAQAAIVFPEGAFGLSEGQNGVRVTIRPLAPAGIAQHPEGLEFDGNAYDFEVVYEPSGAAAVPTLPVSIVLTYPIRAVELLRLGGRQWTPIPSKVARAGMKIFAETDSLGTFVAAHEEQTSQFFRWLIYASAAAAVLGLLAGLFVRLRIKKLDERAAGPQAIS